MLLKMIQFWHLPYNNLTTVVLIYFTIKHKQVIKNDFDISIKIKKKHH